jgi:proline iminopeptidase
MKRIALIPFVTLALPAFASGAFADTLDVGDGVKLWYTIKGHGDAPPIIVVHGGPGMDSGSLSGDLGPLEAKHRLLYYDQRGGGRSSLPADTKLLTIDRHVDDLEALRRHLGVDKIVLIGHSFGPAIIAGYAIRYPGHVDRMVLLGPIPPRKGKFVEEYGRTIESRLTDAQRKRSALLRKQYESADVVAACREYWAINTVPRLSKSVKPSVVRSDFCSAPPEAIRYGTAKTSEVTFESLGDWDWTADLRKVSAPALIVHGEEDAIPMAMVAEWASALPNARLMKVPNAAHFPYAERPALVFPEIEKFLAQ